MNASSELQTIICSAYVVSLAFWGGPLGDLGDFGLPRRWSGAGVGGGILREYRNVSTSQRFKDLKNDLPKYQDTTPSHNYSKICHMS